MGSVGETRVSRAKGRVLVLSVRRRLRGVWVVKGMS
jgi:hypothetical protein